MSEPITIPYLPGVKPFTLPFPVGSAALFTNPDPRLRPRWEVPHLTGIDAGFVVTPQAFPELYKEFHRMLAKAGVKNYTLMIAEGNPSYAGRVSRGSRRIFINQAILNAWKFDEVLTMVVGHEIGHAWRCEHRDAKALPAPAAFSAYKQTEYESDMIGMCLRGNTTGFKQWIGDRQIHGQADYYPTNEELFAGLKTMKWADCPVGGLDVATPFEVPPLLRRSPAKTRP